MTGGTDFVGKYSAHIRGKDVAASDRHGNHRSCQNIELFQIRRMPSSNSLFVYIPSNMQTSYLVEDTTVSHHSSLRVHVLVWPLSFDGHDPLRLGRDDDLPDQLGGQILE